MRRFKPAPRGQQMLVMILPVGLRNSPGIDCDHARSFHLIEVRALLFQRGCARYCIVQCIIENPIESETSGKGPNV